MIRNSIIAHDVAKIPQLRNNFLGVVHQEGCPLSQNQACRILVGETRVCEVHSVAPDGYNSLPIHQTSLFVWELSPAARQGWEIVAIALTTGAVGDLAGQTSKDFERRFGHLQVFVRGTGCP